MDKVTASSEGFVVDAELLADAFGIAPAAVPIMLRSGKITSQCETGTGEDTGRWRLTFYSEERALRLTVNGVGTVLARSTFPAHPPRVAPANQPPSS